MFSVRVEDSFAAAHYLKNYHGKCERLHGHNYRVRVTVSGKKLNGGGMLIDFGILKDALKEVLTRYDHRNLNELDEFKEGDPSAEKIAYTIYQNLNKLIVTEGIEITSVEVFETEKNLAIYSPD